MHACYGKISHTVKSRLQSLFSPFSFDTFISYFNEHRHSADNLCLTFISFFHSHTHPIFIFTVFYSVSKRVWFYIYRSGMTEIHAVCPLDGEHEISKRARPALLRGVLRIVSGYPVAVFSGKMNRFTTNNFPWASTRPRPSTPARTTHAMDNSSESGVTGCRISGAVDGKRW